MPNSASGSAAPTLARSACSVTCPYIGGPAPSERTTPVLGVPTRATCSALTESAQLDRSSAATKTVAALFTVSIVAANVMTAVLIAFAVEESLA